ncbi:MAG: flagellar hook-basal body complex protein, partial [Bacteroidaceae bacterium]|nr:flagellar hook-basal body complex protein [Bacteroidaceae bacterium]
MGNTATILPLTDVYDISESDMLKVRNEGGTTEKYCLRVADTASTGLVKKATKENDQQPDIFYFSSDFKTLCKVQDAYSYDVQFDGRTGTFSYVGAKEDNLKEQVLMIKDILPQKEDPSKTIADLDKISIDFSNLLNYDNGGSSTVQLERGGLDGTSGAGKKLGNMTGVSVDTSGKIWGSYDNGNTVLLGQIAVAQFSNASGLEEMGSNCYKSTLNSGDANIVDVSADGGSMNTGQLEMSNVDLSAEFTDMIVTQRGFQA